MNVYYEQLKPYIEKLNAFRTVQSLLDWDGQTLAPPESGEKTASVASVIAGEYQKVITSQEVRELLGRLAGEDGLTESEQAVVRLLRRDLDRLDVISPDEYVEYSRVVSLAGRKWEKAKQADDFGLFEDSLRQVVDYTRRFAQARAGEGVHPYDVLLDDYEEGFTIEKLDEFFGRLKEEIVPLLQAIRTCGHEIDDSFLQQPYDVGRQKEFCRWMSGYMGFDFGRGVIAESEHPFTMGFHNADVRITNHFYENQFVDALFSGIHETGHALFEQNISDELTQTPAGSEMSMGIHESQSRFYENILGRSRSFWVPVYGKLQEFFPAQLGQVPLDDFVRAVNKVQPGPVRVSADELTYPLHIMIRYELEKQLVSGELDVKDLPGRWNDCYEEYLGLRPESAAQGVLQDVHWSYGDIGYFPSYALGSAFGAQMIAYMKKTMNVDGILKSGDIKPITRFLSEHIHRFGAMKNSRQILKDMTGEDFNPEYYISYLKEKFSRLYQL